MIIDTIEYQKVNIEGKGELWFDEIRKGDIINNKFEAVSDAYLSLDLPEGSYEAEVKYI